MLNFCVEVGLPRKFYVFIRLSGRDAERSLSTVSLRNKLLCFEGKPASFLSV